MYGETIVFSMNYFDETVFKQTKDGSVRPTTPELEEAVEFLNKEIKERREAAAKGEARNGGTTLED